MLFLVKLNYKFCSKGDTVFLLILVRIKKGWQQHCLAAGFPPCPVFQGRASAAAPPHPALGPGFWGPAARKCCCRPFLILRRLNGKSTVPLFIPSNG